MAAGFSFRIRFLMIPRILAAAVEVILILSGFFQGPKEKTSPPIPATKITEVTKIFFVFPMSTCSWILLLTPDAAMNPYKSRETPPVTQAGIVSVIALRGEMKERRMENKQAKQMTRTEATFVTPTTATVSP